MIIKTKCRFPKLCKHPHTEDGECDKFCSFNTKKIKTNADHLRMMTDEELAKELERIDDTACAFNRPRTYEGWLDWLKKEVDDG